MFFNYYASEKEVSMVKYPGRGFRFPNLFQDFAPSPQQRYDVT
jgi:hypothetical protein